MTVRTRAIDLRRSWLLCEDVGQHSFLFCLLDICRLLCLGMGGSLDIPNVRGGWFQSGLHLVQLAAGRNDLLDAQLAELSLELAELLHQIILALVPKLDCLNLGRRLETWGQHFMSSFEEFLKFP
jgi:hypothetical protein